VNGLIAGANIQGQAGDGGLSESSTDREVWNVCQAEQLILITDNRNLDSEDSLEATIRRNNTPTSLPVFTIADMSEFRTDNSYVELEIESLFDYLVRIDDVRGTGRRYLP
jgi:hypothetical protein